LWFCLCDHETFNTNFVRDIIVTQKLYLGKFL
jgi:hypothetical protein